MRDSCLALTTVVASRVKSRGGDRRRATTERVQLLAADPAGEPTFRAGRDMLEYRQKLLRNSAFWKGFCCRVDGWVRRNWSRDLGERREGEDCSNATGADWENRSAGTGKSTRDPLNASELAPNSANGLIPSLIAWAKSQPPGNVAIVSILSSVTWHTDSGIEDLALDYAI